LHAQIKGYIVSSREDLLGVCTALKIAVDRQINEMKILIEQQKIMYYAHFGTVFDRVRNKISAYALDLVLKQLSLPWPLKSCSGSFSQVYGIPCAHILEAKLVADEKLDTTVFCSQWLLFPSHSAQDEANSFEAQMHWLQSLAQTGGEHVGRALATQLQKIGVYSLINNPAIVCSGRGRPVGAKNTTRRDPSQFEYVERTTSQFRCGRCHALGHNRRTCTANVADK
jgi:hypothetical protein